MMEDRDITGEVDLRAETPEGNEIQICCGSIISMPMRIKIAAPASVAGNPMQNRAAEMMKGLMPGIIR
jgi:hypothetical protein